MSSKTIPSFEIKHHFDNQNMRHYINGTCSVLHCHHYSTLMTELAVDAVDFDGIKNLTRTSEEVFYHILKTYYHEHNITEIADMLAIAEQYWQAMGMGLLRFTGAGPYELSAEMEYSHIDAGWLKKMEKNDQPVNFFTAGFVSAVAALINEKPLFSFGTLEVKSLVCGDEISSFKAVIQ